MTQSTQSPQSAAQELKTLVLENSTQGYVFKNKQNRAKIAFACEDDQDQDSSPEKAIDSRLFAWWIDNALNGIRQGWASIERGRSGLIFRFTGKGDKFPSAGVRFELDARIPEDLLRLVAQLK